jgi:hypothetical protein
MYIYNKNMESIHIKNVIDCNKIIINSEKIIKQDNDYYNDVLTFLNLIFTTNSDSILKLKISKIALNPSILSYYNDLNELYNLKKNSFDIEKYDFNLNHEFDEILQIILILVNNVLEKLNYKLIKTTNNKLFIKSLF